MRPIPALIFLFCFSSSNPSLGQISYTPDATLRSSLKKEVWETLKSFTPSSYQLAMSLSFSGSRPFKDYEKSSKKAGYEPHDVATVYTFLRVICEEAITNSQLSSDRIQTLYQNTEKEISQLAPWSDLSESEKQQRCDPVILKSAWLAYFFNLSKHKDPSTAQKYAQQFLAEVFDGSSNVALDQPTETSSSSPQPPTTTIQEQPTSLPSSTGLSHDEIEMVIAKTQNRIGIDGDLQIDLRNYVFLQDGDIYAYEDLSPYILDMSESKSSDPHHWGKWKKQGSKVLVKFKKDWNEWSTWFKTSPSNEGQTLTGAYKSRDPFDGSGRHRFNTLVFQKDGRFVLRYFYAPGYSRYRADDEDFVPHKDDSQVTGKYRLQGYEIELNYDNGGQEKFLFAHFKNGTGFIMGVDQFHPFESQYLKP